MLIFSEGDKRRRCPIATLVCNHFGLIPLCTANVSMLPLQQQRSQDLHAMALSQSIPCRRQCTNSCCRNRCRLRPAFSEMTTTGPESIAE
jgi:hypothetical protein